MKAKILFLVWLLSALAILGGCFAHWEGPSSKAAEQVDNYLENERDTFFYRYCYLYGVALDCLNEGTTSSLDDCKEELDKAFAYRSANFGNARRFIKPSSFDHIKVASGNKKMEKMKKSKDKKAQIEFFKEALNYTIDAFTEKEWDKCREVAEVK